MARGCFVAEDESGVKLRNERRPMSAAVLKRKIRNFPAANLTERITASS
jgi:hypothetical protein